MANFLSVLAWPFKKLGKLTGKAVEIAIIDGLGDEVLGEALKWVKVAANKFVDNNEKREWVVKILIANGVPGPIARIAVELAVKLFKKSLENNDV